MLRLLHEAGATCRHWGDTDPDGYLIAELLNRYIETSLYRCQQEDILRHKEDLKPLDPSQVKRGQYIMKPHPNFKFREELGLVLQLGGWLEQERSIT